MRGILSRMSVFPHVSTMERHAFIANSVRFLNDIRLECYSTGFVAAY